MAVISPPTGEVHAAVRTTEIELGTGMLQAPLRNPVVLAKEIATLQVLSHGRFLLGGGKLPTEPSPDKAYIAGPVLVRILRADEGHAAGAGGRCGQDPTAES